MNRVHIGYDPAHGRDGIVVVEVRPRMHGFHAACRNALSRLDGQTNRPPGPLDEYPSRVEHARAHRRRSEIRRRDRRRARTGRAPIRLSARSRPRMLEITNALAAAGPAFARAGQAVRAFAEHLEPALVETQRRINEMVAAASHATVPHRFMAGTWDDVEGATPRGTIRDDVEAYRRSVEAELTESGRARREQALAGPYITADELHRQIADAEQQEAERAERYRREFARLRARDGEVRAAEEMARRHGGIVRHHRGPDDDTVPVRIARFIPVERWMLDDLGYPVNGGPARDITHHDRWLGEGTLERDETSSVHSTDSSGTGAVWSDLMSRIDDLIEE